MNMQKSALKKKFSKFSKSLLLLCQYSVLIFPCSISLADAVWLHQSGLPTNTQSTLRLQSGATVSSSVNPTGATVTRKSASQAPTVVMKNGNASITPYPKLYKLNIPFVFLCSSYSMPCSSSSMSGSTYSQPDQRYKDTNIVLDLSSNNWGFLGYGVLENNYFYGVVFRGGNLIFPLQLFLRNYWSGCSPTQFVYTSENASLPTTLCLSISAMGNGTTGTGIKGENFIYSIDDDLSKPVSLSSFHSVLKAINSYDLTTGISNSLGKSGVFELATISPVEKIWVKQSIVVPLFSLGAVSDPVKAGDIGYTGGTLTYAACSYPAKNITDCMNKSFKHP